MLTGQVGTLTCHTCKTRERQIWRTYDAFENKMSLPHEFKWMCADCLFTAVRDGALLIRFPDGKPHAFNLVDESGDWMCYQCNKEQQRVGQTQSEVFALSYLCPECLIRMIEADEIHLSLGNQPTEEAAPIGPTAKVDDDGVISIDGMTFRW